MKILLSLWILILLGCINISETSSEANTKENKDIIPEIVSSPFSNNDKCSKAKEIKEQGLFSDAEIINFFQQPARNYSNARMIQIGEESKQLLKNYQSNIKELRDEFGHETCYGMGQLEDFKIVGGTLVPIKLTPTPIPTPTPSPPTPTPTITPTPSPPTPTPTPTPVLPETTWETIDFGFQLTKSSDLEGYKTTGEGEFLIDLPIYEDISWATGTFGPSDDMLKTELRYHNFDLEIYFEVSAEILENSILAGIREEDTFYVDPVTVDKIAPSIYELGVQSNYDYECTFYNPEDDLEIIPQEKIIKVEKLPWVFSPLRFMEPPLNLFGMTKEFSVPVGQGGPGLRYSSLGFYTYYDDLLEKEFFSRESCFILDGIVFRFRISYVDDPLLSVFKSKEELNKEYGLLAGQVAYVEDGPSGFFYPINPQNSWDGKSRWLGSEWNLEPYNLKDYRIRELYSAIQTFKIKQGYYTNDYTNCAFFKNGIQPKLNEACPIVD